jgi:hypothetical protein
MFCQDPDAHLRHGEAAFAFAREAVGAGGLEERQEVRARPVDDQDVELIDAAMRGLKLLVIAEGPSPEACWSDTHRSSAHASRSSVPGSPECTVGYGRR